MASVEPRGGRPAQSAAAPPRGRRVGCCRGSARRPVVTLALPVGGLVGRSGAAESKNASPGRQGVRQCGPWRRRGRAIIVRNDGRPRDIVRPPNGELGGKALSRLLIIRPIHPLPGRLTEALRWLEETEPIRRAAGQ